MVKKNNLTILTCCGDNGNSVQHSSSKRPLHLRLSILAVPTIFPDGYEHVSLEAQHDLLCNECPVLWVEYIHLHYNVPQKIDMPFPSQLHIIFDFLFIRPFKVHKYKFLLNHQECSCNTAWYVLHWDFLCSPLCCSLYVFPLWFSFIFSIT